MVDRRNSEFERWLFDGHISLKDAATLCASVLHDLYGFYYDDWYHHIREKAESITEVKKP